MRIKIYFLFLIVSFSNTNLHSQEGEYIPIESFIFRHQQFTVNQNSIIVPPVDRFINNRISFFIEEEFFRHREINTKCYLGIIPIKNQYIISFS